MCCPRRRRPRRHGPFQCTCFALLRDASSQIELKTGESYRGTLVEAEDNWNSQLANIVVTARVRAPATRKRAPFTSPPQDGRVSSLESVFIRGSKIRYFVMPDMLQNAPSASLADLD